MRERVNERERERQRMGKRNKISTTTRGIKAEDNFQIDEINRELNSHQMMIIALYLIFIDENEQACTYRNSERPETE